MEDSKLLGQNCVPCRGDTPSLSRDEAKVLMAETPGWTISEDSKWIRRAFKFKDFMGALRFLNRVAEVAESEGHHPDYQGGWGKLKLELTTHAIKGLSRNDFILAAKINALLP